MKHDFVVVGSGLTGAVIARILADAGQDVIVLDRRGQLGGNVADRRHESGIIVPDYGPHFFRTVSDKIWQFVNRFTRFHPYRHQAKTFVDGKIENWPIAASYIQKVCGKDWKPAIQIKRPTNFEEAALSLMPRLIYEKFVKKYTEKQWGVPATQLSAALCKRFDVREDDNPFLSPKAKYQGLPVDGYRVMMDRMLDGITVLLNVDYLQVKKEYPSRKMTIFTGPIDEYFGFELGKLDYRGQKRENTYFQDKDHVLGTAQINYPDDRNQIRDIEWKYLMPPEQWNTFNGTVLTRETPWSPDHPDRYEYPFPDDVNQERYQRYRAIADDLPDVLICGRLGEYRYYDMDHAIGRAFKLAEKILSCMDRPQKLLS